MSEYGSGAYFIKRNRGGGRGRRAAFVLISVLLILTAVICLLVVYLPRITAGAPTNGGGSVSKRFYMLTTFDGVVRDDALLASQDAVSRGGAGYIYNNGAYKVIAAVYDNEADARALASVNENAQYFAVDIIVPNNADSGTVSAVEYLTGEWFAEVGRAADELQRKNITEAQAEYAVISACRKLAEKASQAELPQFARALEQVSEYECPQNMLPLSYIHYVHVRAIAEVHFASSEA